MLKPTRCDSHIHTENSFDSETPAELQVDRAHELGIEYITITDHCDILDWDDSDIARSNAQAVELNSKYSDLTVLRGIELGEPLQDLEGTAQALGLCEYDFVLCSLHNIRNEEDFYFLHPTIDEAHDLLTRYFDELLDMVRWNEFDSLAHLTYPLRYMVGREKLDIDMISYKPVIREILGTLAANGKALEINTSGRRTDEGFLMPTVEYVKLFHELGGKYITLGSDAHVPEHLAVGMSDGIAAAKEAGFSCATIFVERKPVEIPFE